MFSLSVLCHWPAIGTKLFSPFIYTHFVIQATVCCAQCLSCVLLFISKHTFACSCIRLPTKMTLTNFISFVTVFEYNVKRVQCPLIIYILPLISINVFSIIQTHDTIQLSLRCTKFGFVANFMPLYSKPCNRYKAS